MPILTPSEYVGTPEHQAWKNMRGRCYCATRPDYKHYGGRGITVCDRWLESFENFFADMGPRLSPKHSLDRVNRNGNYEKSNCRWATSLQQMNNTSRVKLYPHKGERLSLPDLARKYGVNYHRLRSRIKRGWILEYALSVPYYGSWRGNAEINGNIEPIRKTP